MPTMPQIKLQQGFEEANSSNLPMVDTDMISLYLLNNADFLKVEVRDTKALRSARDTYGDHAIRYVQLKRVKSICVIRACINPEHNIPSVPYQLLAEVDETEDDEKIVSCQCLGCVSSQGGCKHILAFMYWLKRQTDDKSVTDTQCYWKSDNISLPASNQLVKVSDFTKQQLVKSVDSTFKDALARKLQEMKVEDAMCLKYLVPSYCSERSLSIHYLRCQYLKTANTVTFDGFSKFVSSQMTPHLCLDITKKTMEQRSSKEWLEYRYARVTASILHQASRAKKHDALLTDIIMGANPILETGAMRRREDLKVQVLQQSKKQLKLHHIKRAGLYLHPSCPFFGASPDGITDDACFAVKCPSKQSTVKDYKRTDGTPSPKVYAQMQLEMHLTLCKKAFLCIAHPHFEAIKEVEIIEIVYDREYCAEIIKTAEIFYKNAIFPILFKT